MEGKDCVICNPEKVLIIFITNIKNANRVIYDEAKNVTMIIKIKYQCNKKCIMKKRDKLLQKKNDYRNKRR